MKKMNNKGFTLMEMLIVVAIIAVLVAIAIPVFNNQLEKAREATDMANLRSAYAEVMATALTDTNRDATPNATKGDNDVYKTVAGGSAIWYKDVELQQKKADWQSGKTNIGGVPVENELAVAGATLRVQYSEADAKVTITKVK